MKVVVERIVKVKEISITPEEWELYTYRDPAACAQAALLFNGWLLELVNDGLTRADVESRMHKVMSSYAGLGAIDSEPMHTLQRALTEIFGKEYCE